MTELELYTEFLSHNLVHKTEFVSHNLVHKNQICGQQFEVRIWNDNGI